MSSQDFSRIDEVYHNMYKNKFHREEPLVKEGDCGGDCDDCEECKQDQSSTPLQKKERAKYLKSPAGEAAEEELGPDPKDLAQYDEYEKSRKEISYDKYPFWDAYHAVKEGAWSEDDFHQWCQTVWNAGAEEGNRPPLGAEDAEHVFAPTYKAAKHAGYSEVIAKKIAGAAKAKANK